MRADAEHAFSRHRLHWEIFGERMCHLPGQAYANQIELLRNAICVLTDSADVREEAIALEIPCLWIGICDESLAASPCSTAATNGDAGQPAWVTRPLADDSTETEYLDGPASARIAEHLCTWLRHLAPRASAV